MNFSREKIKAFSAIVSGSFLILLSLTVLFGWYTRNETLIRILPSYAVMVYNTALSFLAIGIGFVFLTTRWKLITRVASFFVMTLTFLIGMQYLFKTGLYVDELFHKYDLLTPMHYPGRTSLNTVISLFMGSTSLFLLSFKRNDVNLVVSLILSCTSLSIPITSVFGYFAGLESVVEWTYFARMALHTAIGCIFMGSTVLLWAILDSLGSDFQLYVFPLAVSFSVIIGTIAVWRAFYARDFIASRTTAENKASVLQITINSLIREDVDALKRMAERWGVLGGYSENLWKIDAGNYIQDLPALTSIKIVDKELKVIEQTSLLQSKTTDLSEKYAVQFKALKEEKLSFYYDKSQGLLKVFIPIKSNSHIGEFMYAAIDIAAIFQNAIEVLKTYHYKIIFFSENRVVFSGKDIESSTVGPPIEKVVAENFNPFILQLFITKKSLKEESSNLGIFIFLTGIFMTFVTGAATYFAIKTRMKEALLVILNKDLRFSKEKADQANIAKSSFLATMSHEIRTPLNAVIGTIQILAETEVNDVQKKYIKRIDFSSKALLNLINDILDYSKIEAGSLKFESSPSDIVELAKNVCEGFFVKSEEKKIPIYLIAPNQPIPQVICDAHRIEQILMNLINNAFKFTDQGEIILKIEYKPKDQTKAYLYFEVADTGMGISDENQKKLFQKFSQVEVSHARKFGGVGLGLSICKGLVEKMQGQIGVISSEGKGATFWFEIPFSLQVGEELINYSLENTQILLLDSCKKESMIISNYLKAWNANIQTELIGDLSGIQLAIVSFDQKDKVQKLQEKKTPILYIENGKQQEGEDLIIKPITPKALWDAIQKKRGK